MLSQPDPARGTLTKIATWNIERQQSYDGPINVCIQGAIDLLHITEPPAYISVPGSAAAATQTHTADRAGFTVYLNKHSHTYLRQTTILPRLLSQRISHNGRIHTFILHGPHDDAPTVIVATYAFQRGYKLHSPPTVVRDTNDNPLHMQQTFTTLLTDLHASYPQLTLLLLGDFQHTIMHNNLHRMGKHLPAPPADILGLCLRSPFFLVSVIPHCHPEQTYHTWISNSGSGRAGLD